MFDVWADVLIGSYILLSFSAYCLCHWLVNLCGHRMHFCPLNIVPCLYEREYLWLLLRDVWFIVWSALFSDTGPYLQWWLWVPILSATKSPDWPPDSEPSVKAARTPLLLSVRVLRWASTSVSTSSAMVDGTAPPSVRGPSLAKSCEWVSSSAWHAGFQWHKRCVCLHVSLDLLL